MNEYLLLFRGGNSTMANHSAEERQAHMQQWIQWMGNLAKDGVMLGAQPLRGSGRQVTGTAKVVTDGPFIEGKEMVGGYLLCKADSYEGAVEISKGCPILQFEDGKVEVREISQM